MAVGIVQGINTSPGVIPAAITGANNNYSPAGMVPYSTLWLDLSGAASLTGLAALPADSEVTIVNISTTQARIITLNHQNAGSTAANRFVLPNALDWFIPNGGSATFKYSGTASRWYLKNWTGNHFPAGSTTFPGIVVGPDVDDGIIQNSSGLSPGFTTDGTQCGYWGANTGSYNSGTGLSNFAGPTVFASYTEEFGTISPAAINSNQTDYAPTGNTSCRNIRQSVTGACEIISFNGPGGSGLGNGGRLIRIFNISSTGANTLTLRHDDGVNGTAAYRFLCPNNANYIIRANGFAEIFYDHTSSRWRVLDA